MLRFKLYEKKSKVKINPKKEDCMEAKKHAVDCTCGVCEARREKEKPETTVEDWKPEITHSKMGDATKKAAEKRKKEAQKGLPPHLQGDWLAKARKAFKENYRVLARDKGDKGRPAQFSYKDEKLAKKFADSVKSKGGKATVAKEQRRWADDGSDHSSTQLHNTNPGDGKGVSFNFKRTFGKGSGNKYSNINLKAGGTKIFDRTSQTTTTGTKPSVALDMALNKFANQTGDTSKTDWLGTGGAGNSSFNNSKSNISYTGGVSKRSAKFREEVELTERKSRLERTIRKLKTGRLKDPLAGKTKELLDAGKKFHDDYTKKYKKEENELEKRAKANEKARKWLKKDAKKSGYTDIALKASMSKGAGVSEGVVGEIKKGVKRHKDAVEKKKIKNRKAVPYAALAAEHEPKGEEIKEAPLVSTRKKDWPKGSIDATDKKTKLAADLVNLEKQDKRAGWTTKQLKKKNEEVEPIDETYYDKNRRGISTKGGFVKQYNKPGKLSRASLNHERKSKNPELRMSKKELRKSMEDDANYEKKMGRSKPTPSNLKSALKKQSRKEEVELTLMSFQEKTRYAKETGKSYKSGKAQPKGGSAKGDAAFKSVIARIKSEYGKNALAGGEGQIKKKKGEKGRQQPGDRRGKPADTIARRRQMKKDAEAAMRDTRGT